MFKIGDKLTCKKDLQITNSNVNKNMKGLKFTKGIEYNVFQVDDVYNEVLIGKDIFYHWFWFGRINDYFYNEKELRKLKLERLTSV